MLRRRSILADLARDLLATGARLRGDPVKLARLAVDGDVDVDIAMLIRAASMTCNLGSMALAGRIGRKAMAFSPDLAAGWDLANTLIFRGDAQRSATGCSSLGEPPRIT